MRKLKEALHDKYVPIVAAALRRYCIFLHDLLLRK
jgi:hypothetical protein